jgi:uncharacterized delta-60 repeat protein
MKRSNGDRRNVGIEALEGRAYLSAGALDPSFLNGVRLLPSSSADYATAVAPQSDGKVIVAGRNDGAVTDGMAVARYNADGSLDTSFGQDGKVSVPFDRGGYVNRVAVQPDGKIILAGGSNLDFVVVRLNPDGSLDTTFGNGGISQVDFAGRTDNLYGLALRPDGKILVAGSASTSAADFDFAVLQYNADGSFDSTFGSGGKVVLGTAGKREEIRDVSLLADGRIAVAGSVNGMGAVARLTAGGAFDTSFGTGGLVVTRLSQPLGTVLALKGGGVLVAGGDGSRFVAARLTGSGAFDTSFGVNGMSKVDFGYDYEYVSDLTIQKGGKIVLVGSVGSADIYDQNRPIDYALARLNTDGGLDRSFGRRGLTTLSFNADSDSAAGVALFAKGRMVVVGGHTVLSSPTGMDFQVARFTANGGLDASFGGGGKVATDFTTSAKTSAVAVSTLASGGELVLASHSDGNLERFALTRYRADGTIDTTFGTRGTVYLNFGGLENHPAAMAVAADGTIAVAGYADRGEFTHTVGVVALLDEGGTRIAGFGADGKVVDTTPIASFGVSAVAFQNGGVIVARGDGTAFVARRYRRDGTVDSTFGTDGVVRTDFTPSADALTAYARVNDIAVQDDGSFVLAGVRGHNVDFGISPQNVFAIARYTPDGQLDTTFGNGGRVTLSIGTLVNNDVANAVAIQPDGKIVVAGQSGAGTNPLEAPRGAMAVMRLNKNGTPDRTFGNNGRVTVAFGPYDDTANDVLIQGDGKILLAGRTRTGSPNIAHSNSDFALARLNADGTPDASFGTGGKISVNVGLDDDISDIALNGAGQIVAVGHSVSQAYLARFLNDAPGIRAEIVADTLVITGTPADDQIVLGRDDDGGINIVGIDFHEATAPHFSRILIRGMGGNDMLSAAMLASDEVRFRQRLIPVTIEGGTGDNWLYGGPADDVLFGGDGNDFIQSGAGKDTLFGGRGEDTLDGGLGNDYLNPGPDADRVIGGFENDQIFSLDGSPDTIYGDDGFDRVKTDPADVLTDTEALLA